MEKVLCSWRRKRHTAVNGVWLMGTQIETMRRRQAAEGVKGC